MSNIARRTFKRLNDLLDVTLTNPAEGQLLEFDSAGQVWINAAAGAADNLGNHTATQDLNMAGFNLDSVNSLYLNEKDSAGQDIAADGNLWVKTATPNELYFTDDEGNDKKVEMRGRYKYVYIPAGALTPDATDGATAGTAEINDSAGLGYTFDYLSFDYQTANDKASWTMMMPDDWDESTTLKFKPAWTVDPLAAAQPTSSTCHWDFRAIAKTDADSAGSGSWSSTVSSDDTYISQDTIHTGPASGALTVTGAAAGDIIIFEVTRDQGGDSLGIVAWLMGIHMQYQQQEASDAAW